MQSIRAKEHDNSFPYVSLAKTNRCLQLSHQNNLEAVNTGARAPSQHEEEDQAQTRLCTREWDVNLGKGASESVNSPTEFREIPREQSSEDLTPAQS